MRSRYTFYLPVLLAGLALMTCKGRSSKSQGQVVPLLQAHAHNDYAHRRPLLDALAQGFCSVEADIFLKDGQLLVAHEEEETKPDRTLQSLYLDPLLKRVQQNQGRLYPGGPLCTLFIDLKTDAQSTYPALHEVLARYEEMLTTYGPEGRRERAITVILSGNRPGVEVLQAQEKRFAALDGRLSDLECEISAEIMPVISDKWPDHFQWNGFGRMPAEEKEKLAWIVAKAHEKQRKVRFWSTPDLPSPARAAVWRTLRDGGVDFINTDDLKALKVFLLTQPSVPTQEIRPPRTPGKDMASGCSNSRCPWKRE